ncbi:hypothetical protein [Endozoicomonas numazuensis]|uniref:hypothetical protein n=1 Tax=Endozoicomonas numazuensis TaxID=1137799 RepID=UPI00068F2039|nr:hypothetical protein [Endozoicomonas numazuensis]
MGVVKDCFRVLNEIVTLGGYGRLEEAQEQYQASYNAYKEVHDEASAIDKSVNSNLEQLGNSVERVKYRLDRVEKLLKAAVNTSLQTEISPSESLERLESFGSSFSTAAGVGFGSVLGGSAAVGAWALVSILGSASTGTAIAGLSGVAATNATLAWFGGGALAAGGAGMSGGMMVLGGIVAAPIIIFSAWGTHKKAEKVEAEKIKVDSELQSLSEKMPGFRKQLQAVEEYTQQMREICEAYNSNIDEKLNTVYPMGVLSVLKQKILRLFNRNPYREEQVQAIEGVGVATQEILDMFTCTQKEVDTDL